MKAMTAERCSGIKSGYWSAEKKEDLVQQLGLYEHQVLSPAKIEQFQKLRTRLKGAREIVELANECGRQGLRRGQTLRLPVRRREHGELRPAAGSKVRRDHRAAARFGRDDGLTDRFRRKRYV